MDSAELEAVRFLAAPLPILLSIALVYVSLSYKLMLLIAQVLR